MKSEKIKISAVSYLNTKPFLYGLEQSGFLDQCILELDVPSACAGKLVAGKADVGLIPVAALTEVKNPRIITDYCIGCEGAVESVLLLSEVPLHKVRRIWLDYQSRTSVKLLKLLAEHFWKINPEWLSATPGFEEKIMGETAGLVIGDRTFALKNRFANVIDLGEEWLKFTSHPFVFACWVSNRTLPDEWLSAFNEALSYGVSNIDKLVDELEKKDQLIAEPAAYLRHKISYKLDERKKKGLNEFLNLAFPGTKSIKC